MPITETEIRDHARQMSPLQIRLSTSYSDILKLTSLESGTVVLHTEIPARIMTPDMAHLLILGNIIFGLQFPTDKAQEYDLTGISISQVATFIEKEFDPNSPIQQNRKILHTTIINSQIPIEITISDQGNTDFSLKAVNRFLIEKL